MISKVSFFVYEVLTLKLNIKTRSESLTLCYQKANGQPRYYWESRWQFQKYPRIIMNSWKTHDILITVQQRSYFCCHAIFPLVGETREKDEAGVRKARFTKIPSMIDSWDQEGFMNNDVLFIATCYIHWKQPRVREPKKIIPMTTNIPLAIVIG